MAGVRKRRLVISLIASSALAVACGGGHHRPAPSPSPAVRIPPVHSLRLTRQLPLRVRATCAQARRLVRIAVVCPPLVPRGGVVADRDLYGAEGPRIPDEAGDFYLLTFNNGENRGHIHWIVGAGRDRTVERFLFDSRDWVAPGRLRRLRTRRYGPWTIAFYRLPPHPSGGELGGHDLALCRLGGTTYFASVHGWAHDDADAAMLIAMLLTARAGGRG